MQNSYKVLVDVCGALLDDAVFLENGSCLILNCSIGLDVTVVARDLSYDFHGLAAGKVAGAGWVADGVEWTSSVSGDDVVGS